VACIPTNLKSKSGANSPPVLGLGPPISDSSFPLHFGLFQSFSLQGGLFVKGVDSGGSSRTIWGARPMASAVARAYNGDPGAEPQAGSRAGVPGQVARGQSFPEAEALLAFGRSMKAANLTTF